MSAGKYEIQNMQSGQQGRLGKREADPRAVTNR